MSICKQCNKGDNLRDNRKLHRNCEVLWNANHIPKNQKRKLSMCPTCGKRFYYWQKASKHAHEKKHFGDYTVR